MHHTQCMWWWGTTQGLVHCRQALYQLPNTIFNSTWPSTSMPRGLTVLFKGPIREGKKQWSGDSSRLVGPHTNMGSLALAMTGTQSACVCAKGSPLTHHLSLLLALGLSQAHRVQSRNIISIWTYPSAAADLLQILSEDSGNFYAGKRLI